ncbi:MAG: hypothetical protein ACO1OB_08545 [Archangium sp.]
MRGHRSAQRWAVVKRLRMDSSMLPMVLGSLVAALPQLLVLVAALIIAMNKWSTLPTVGMYVAAGAGVLLLTTLISRGVLTALPVMWMQNGVSSGDVGLRMTGVSVVTSLLHAIGLGLLVAAVFAQREATRER